MPLPLFLAKRVKPHLHQHGNGVCFAVVFNNQAINHTVQIDALEINFLACCWNAHPFACVGDFSRYAHRHPFTFGHRFVALHLKVWKGVFDAMHMRQQPGNARCRMRRRVVILVGGRDVFSCQIGFAF